MDHPFQFRPGTLDEGVFYSVCEANEYRLPEAFRPDDIIIDVGMHIGSFCYAALRRGSNYVHGFEAELSNYESAVRNLRPFGPSAIASPCITRRSGDLIGMCTHSDSSARQMASTPAVEMWSSRWGSAKSRRSPSMRSSSPSPTAAGSGCGC